MRTVKDHIEATRKRLAEAAAKRTEAAKLMKEKKINTSTRKTKKT
jgi:hypothetical protein